jgi:hypothetical protein
MAGLRIDGLISWYATIGLKGKNVISGVESMSVFRGR